MALCAVCVCWMQAVIACRKTNKRTERVKNCASAFAAIRQMSVLLDKAFGNTRWVIDTQLKTPNLQTPTQSVISSSSFADIKLRPDNVMSRLYLSYIPFPYLIRPANAHTSKIHLYLNLYFERDNFLVFYYLIRHNYINCTLRLVCKFLLEFAIEECFTRNQTNNTLFMRPMNTIRQIDEFEMQRETWIK